MGSNSRLRVDNYFIVIFFIFVGTGVRVRDGVFLCAAQSR